MGFIKGTVSSYYALDQAKRFILAGRVSTGSILAPSVESVPASRRFIAGGGGSIRATPIATSVHARMVKL